MKKVTTHEAKTHLSRLLAEVEAGAEVVVCRGDRPVARLVPASAPREKKRPKIGTRTSGPVGIAKDTFAPMTDAELDEWGVG